ncbi:hypothetical protein NHX12_003067 [Muraenolepis orangiensis]|uniref:Uncharacterized protein n=1 Tax=Muraenolepis orangiensis TaxID=630683 RepID=A0A9Q0DYF2_9TELE|nr:hypothetical protein NHX12_003067 [Muraenolepis orangiensis]
MLFSDRQIRDQSGEWDGGFLYPPPPKLLLRLSSCRQSRNRFPRADVQSVAYGVGGGELFVIYDEEV